MKKLLLTLVACVTALAANAWTVYFTNPEGWAQPYVWAWHQPNNANDTGGNWPGAPMEKDGNLWKYTGTGNPSQLLFNIGSNAKQTGDLTFKEGAIYNFWEALPSVVYIIGNVGSYAWNPTEGIEIPAESPGIYVLNGVKINDTFAFTTQLSSSGSDWDTCNNNRYGPDNGSVPVSINNSYDVTTHGNSMNSWKIDNAGTYKVTLNLITNKIYIDPVDLYIAGNNINGESQWGSQANEPMGELMTSKDGIEYTWSGSILGSDFKIYDGDWDSDLDYGTEQNAGTVLSLGVPYSVVEANGCDNITLKGLSWIQDPVVTFNKENLTVTVTGVKPLYLRGSEIVGGSPWKDKDEDDEEDEGWEINSSYLFKQSDVDGAIVYTLDVASISSSCKFKIATEDWDPGYSYMQGGGEQQMIVGEAYPLQGQNTGETNMGLAESLLNATFTLTLDKTQTAINNGYGGPYTPNATLVITGTVDGSNAWVLTPGNDKTMQDGSISGTTITLTTITNGALVYVYPPQGYTTVYFQDVPSGSNAKRMAAPAGYKTANTLDGAFLVPLAVGKGTLNLIAENEAGTQVTSTYSYFVTKNDFTTGVDGIGADEEDAVYYNLQGVKVDNPEKGIFVKVVNGTASKVVL